MVQQLLSVDGSLSIYKQLLLYKGDRRFGHSVLVKASVCVCVCVCVACVLHQRMKLVQTCLKPLKGKL